MSLLGFNAIGRLAIAQNPIQQQAAIFGGSFHKWDPAPRPKNFSLDWVAFAGHPNAGKFPGGFVFSVFDPAPHPRNFSKDWVAFSGSFLVEQPFYIGPFSPFDPPPKPPRYAKDWVAFSGDYFVQTTTLSFFTEFSKPPKPPRLAKDWIEYSEIGFTVVPVFQIGIDFMPFALGKAAKLWSGQQPQWWPYYLKPPPSKKKDTHDYGWPIRQYHRPHPTVYEEDYYEALKPLTEPTGLTEDPEAPPPERVPNLLIPLSKLHTGTHLPSLTQSPPAPRVASLTTNPPAFRMRTPEENAIDDAEIIRLLLED